VDLLVLLVLLVPAELKDHKDLKVLLAHKEIEVCKVPKEKEEQLVLLEIKALV